MTVETPDTRGPSTAAPRKVRDLPTPESEAVKLKDAGAGAIAAPDPFINYFPSYDPAAYEEERKVAQQGKAATKAAGGPATGQAAKLIERAKSFVGTPYKWGGTGPLGFDCSGFTQYLFRELGINLPRVSYQQGQYGARVGVDKLRPGDLVFWDNSTRNNGADHVAIYIGNGQVIHAPKPGDAVKISNLWDTSHAWGVAMNL